MEPKENGKTVLIWGGASSVGACAIQLAAASGATVLTTASPANHDFVKSLGADHVFDYRSPTVMDDAASVLKGTDFAGV
jgi:NADPH:quinone reductase-like Zn-dependent oxidoreductase